jgi:transposase-like protein
VESYDIDERIRRLEGRYGVTAATLTAHRHEFQVLSHNPAESPARLAHLAQEIERLTRERRRLSDQLQQLEDLPA